MGLSQLKPAVPRNCLIATAGLMWTAAGIILCLMAYRWLTAARSKWSIFLGTAGIFLAILVYAFGFSKIARRNIRRLFQFPDKACFFAFQAWRSYLIITIMVAIGSFLRHSSIPKQFLAVIYLAIGGALFLSSFLYYTHLKNRSLTGQK